MSKHTLQFIVFLSFYLNSCGPNMSFLRFEDAFPAIDHGNPIAPDSISETLVLPIVIRTLYEDGITRRNIYPATQLQMIHYLDSILHYSGNNVTNVIKLDSADTRRTESLKFLASLMRSVTFGTGNPLDWGDSISPEALPTNSRLFIPIAIERESHHAVTGRLYVLVANSTGKILFSRCIEFDPIQWSSNLAVFRREVHNQVPLTSP